MENLDDIDIGIIEMLEKDSNLTHNEIAKKLKRSQPAIGARIKKLQKEGILRHQYGLDFKIMTDMKLVKVEMSASNPDDILTLAKKNPYVINAFKVSGVSNILVFMACSSLKRLDYLIDQYFRKSSEIRNIRMEMITEIANEFVLPIRFRVENFEEINAPVKTPPYIEKKT